MEVEIADRMEDPPQELIPVIEEDSDDIPILKENRDPMPVPPPRIGNTENVEIVEMASQVSCQRCIQSLGRISRQTLCLGTIGTEPLRDTLSRRCCAGRPSSLYTESNIRNNREVGVRVVKACLLFGLQRSSKRGKGGVVVVNELAEEVLDEV